MIPERKAGDYVFGRWNDGGAHTPIAQGWIISGISFLQVLNEPDVEVIK